MFILKESFVQRTPSTKGMPVAGEISPHPAAGFAVGWVNEASSHPPDVKFSRPTGSTESSFDRATCLYYVVHLLQLGSYGI
jgi:hypothetical protein